MRRIHLVSAALATLFASVSQAQSSVTLYGILDAGIMYTNNVSKGGSSGALVQATSASLSGNRFGMRGAEDLGDGLKAIFVLENGFNIQNGKLGQDGRMFGRQAYVGLSTAEYGTVSLGRQYDFLTDFVTPLTGVAGTFGDDSFIHPFDNDNLDHSERLSNTVKYVSPTFAGLKIGGLYAFSNSVDFAVNRAYSAGASYQYGAFKFATAYLQINGSIGTTSSSVGAVDANESSSNGIGGFQVGSDVQRTFGAAMNYAVGPALVGFVYTHSAFQGTNSFGLTDGSVHFDNYELNAQYSLTPALTLGMSDTYTEGHVNGTTTYASDPKWNQINLQADYKLSKRTELYVMGMYQHVTGKNYVAFVNTAGGASSTGNQVVGTVGMRTRF